MTEKDKVSQKARATSVEASADRGKGQKNHNKKHEAQITGSKVDPSSLEDPVNKTAVDGQRREPSRHGRDLAMQMRRAIGQQTTATNKKQGKAVQPLEKGGGLTVQGIFAAVEDAIELKKIKDSLNGLKPSKKDTHALEVARAGQEAKAKQPKGLDPTNKRPA